MTVNNPELVDELLEEFPDLGSTQEVADLLRVRLVTVNKWIRNGNLEAIRAGRRVQRVPKKQLREFLINADSLDEKGNVDEDLEEDEST